MHVCNLSSDQVERLLNDKKWLHQSFFFFSFNPSLIYLSNKFLNCNTHTHTLECTVHWEVWLTWYNPLRLSESIRPQWSVSTAFGLVQSASPPAMWWWLCPCRLPSSMTDVVSFSLRVSLKSRLRDGGVLEVFAEYVLSIAVFFSWWWLPPCPGLFSPAGLGYWPSWATWFQGDSGVLH